MRSINFIRQINLTTKRRCRLSFQSLFRPPEPSHQAQNDEVTIARKNTLFMSDIQTEREASTGALTDRYVYGQTFAE